MTMKIHTWKQFPFYAKAAYKNSFWKLLNKSYLWIEEKKPWEKLENII